MVAEIVDAEESSRQSRMALHAVDGLRIIELVHLDMNHDKNNSLFLWYFSPTSFKDGAY